MLPPRAAGEGDKNPPGHRLDDSPESQDPGCVSGVLIFFKWLRTWCWEGKVSAGKWRHQLLADIGSGTLGLV
jgi:hypothetical protein